MVEAILAPDDRADFLEVRFWSYMKARAIDACRSMFAQTDHTESLDTGYLGKGESEGRTKLESQVDERLSPEKLATVSEGLAKLPPKLRRVFLLRHAVGMAIGGDDPDDDPGDKLTLAQHFGCRGLRCFRGRRRNQCCQAETPLQVSQRLSEGAPALD